MLTGGSIACSVRALALAAGPSRATAWTLSLKHEAEPLPKNLPFPSSVRQRLDLKNKEIAPPGLHVLCWEASADGL